MKEVWQMPESEGTPQIKEENSEDFRKPFSRRTFLKRALGLGLAGAAAGIGLPPVYEGVSNTFGKEKIEESIESLQRELYEKYGIRIKVWEQNPNDRPTGIIRENIKEHSLYRAHRSLLQTKDALEWYPPSLIKEKVGGIDIVYAVRPSNEGMIPEGAESEAETSFGGNITIRAGYQSAISYEATFGDTLHPEVLHHEIAHLIAEDIPEEEWRNLHPGVQYVGNEWITLKKHKPEGFALPYGAKSMAEDIASAAELLFMDPDEVERLIRRDPILNKKVEYLKKWYEKKSNGEMDEDYWKRKSLEKSG